MAQANYNKIDLIDIYRTYNPTTAEYTIISKVHRTFSRIYHMSGHKTCFVKL
jgi:hypothetical protein